MPVKSKANVKTGNLSGLFINKDLLKGTKTKPAISKEPVLKLDNINFG